MSSSRALSCLPSVKEQKHDFNFSFQCIIKQLLDPVLVISRIIEMEVRVILTSTSIILDITKTSSNNCLVFSRYNSYLPLSMLTFRVVSCTFTLHYDTL